MRENEVGESTLSAIWLTQKLISELFSVSVPTINEHLKNIFKSNELQKDSVIRKFLTTALDGKKYNTLFYNLGSCDAIKTLGICCLQDCIKGLLQCSFLWVCKQSI